MNKKSLAQKIWDGQTARIILEDQFMNLNPELPDIDFSFDEYDSSVEIDGLPDEFRLNKDSWRMFKEADFTVIYLNHKNGWETHYHTKKYMNGWRVHYCRENGQAQSIEVEEFPKSWPEEWLKTGYVQIKKETI